MDLNKYHTLHFIGIGGMGMRALANILLRMGFKVTGCISFDSYIKPQPSTGLQLVGFVVYLLIPTSNHN